MQRGAELLHAQEGTLQAVCDIPQLLEEAASRGDARVLGHARPSRRRVHTRAGLPAPCAGLAASLRCPVRAGGARPGAWLLAVGDGAAQPPRRRLRGRSHAERLRLPVGARAGALGGGAGRLGPATQVPAEPPDVHEFTGESASIIAVITSQGSDTKLIGQMQPYLRGARHGSLHARGPVSALACHPDRRRRERRRDDERVPAQVLRGRPRVLELRDTDPQRHRVPRASVRQWSPRGGAAHATAAPAAPRLGADDTG